MGWKIRFSNTARKGIARLPPKVRDAVEFLITELEAIGPVLPRWPHYGKISGRPGCHHCHILRGRPTYVAVWRENDEENEIEVLYVGSHESANYRRIC